MLLQGVEHLLNPKEPMSDGCQKKLTPKGVVALGSDVKWWCKLVSNTSGSKKSSCKTLHTFHVACMRAIFLTNPCQPPKIDTSSVCEGVRWVSTNLFRLNSQDSPPALNGVDVKLEKKNTKTTTWHELYYTTHSTTKKNHCFTSLLWNGWNHWCINIRSTLWVAVPVIPLISQISMHNKI